MITRFKSFMYACNGLKNTWEEETNFRIEVIVSAVVLFSLIHFMFSYTESALCILACALVLAAEILNTAIEDLCNKVEPNQDPQIGKIKDSMAAFVLVIALSACALGIVVFYHHFNV